MEIVAPVVYLHVRQPVVGPFTALEEFDAPVVLSSPLLVAF